MMSEQQQKKKVKKSSEELIKEAESVQRKTISVYIPQICQAVCDENPNFSLTEIQDSVVRRCSHIWAKSWIRQNWGDFTRSYEKTGKYAGIAASRKAEEVIQINKVFKNIPEPKIVEPEPEKYTPLDDETKHGLGLGTFGESNDTITDMRNEILDSAAAFFTALCKKDPPIGAKEDMINDYIKPNRKDFKNLMFELSEEDRASIHNRLHYCIEMAEDRMTAIDEVDKK